MTARIHTDQPLTPGVSLSLPPVAARHVQVLRLQPGHSITLFHGDGETEGEFSATIQSMGRSDVTVLVGEFKPTPAEATCAVHVAIGMPANERMDWLVEKATELGVASIQPLMTERSVLRLAGERAEKKRLHWHGIAVAACEQSGRNRVPLVHAPASLGDWLRTQAAEPPQDTKRLLLSLQAAAHPLAYAVSGSESMTLKPITFKSITFLSGPEGGLSAAEEAAAFAKGFGAVSLGPRVLRSETAPLACLSWLMLTGNT